MARARVEQQEAAEGPRNEVLLVGRVPAAAEERELPSGDVVATFRVVVDRPPEQRATAARRVGIDTLDCAAWGAGVRRTARSLEAGDVVELKGALRRRFWRAGAGAVSRCEVEVGALRRVARAPALPKARRRRTAPPPADGDVTDEV